VGKVVEATPEGWAFRIEWANGMIFFRPPKGEKRGPEPPEHPGQAEPSPQLPGKPEPPRQDVLPPQNPQRLDISGHWTSSTRLAYQIKQEGEAFTFQVVGQDQVIKGTISGRKLQAAWPGGASGQTVTGEISEATDQGRALVIVWSNGITFKR
jgi:hypothetical protein